MVERARRLVGTVVGLRELLRARRVAAEEAIGAMRSLEVGRQLAAVPVDRLAEVAGGRVRLAPVTQAGIATAADVLTAGRTRLVAIPGVGEQTATQLLGAADELARTLAESVRVRFDPDGRPDAHTAVLRALVELDRVWQALGSVVTEAEPVAARIESVIEDADAGSRRMRTFLSLPSQRQEQRAALAALDDVLARHADLEERVLAARVATEVGAPDGSTLWAEFERRPVDFNGWLADVGGLGPDLEASHGFLPTELAERIEAQPLDTSLLRVILRGYQAFGAKFVLTQRKAILGDEMGLGKTIEALAVIGHLHVAGERHSLVVCPASVLANWAHEVVRHSQLATFRLHGSGRDAALGQWAAEGGVAVTTFETLKALELPPGVEVAVLVVDEAHYVKNPSAQRTKAVRQWVGLARRTMFLTGTPMENRVSEFRTLVGHLDPAIAAQIGEVDGLAGSEAFRAAVAPVYLRRNQVDVLSELPERIDAEEWVEMEGADLDAYRRAVGSGNFMAMRRAAFDPGTVEGSAKLDRVAELTADAMVNGHKVVVFSFFRHVIDVVLAVVGDRAAGPITGDVAPAARQQIVDDFTASPHPQVLVCQIEAGGVGLNIQAANVVILTEPQWKPSTEEQAIARCHRMGQVRPVEVHRLLAEDSVDEWMREVLAGKSALFDEYVRRSDLKDATPEAIETGDVVAVFPVGASPTGSVPAEGLPGVGVAGEGVPGEALPALAPESQAEVERRIIAAERERLGVAPAVEV